MSDTKLTPEQEDAARRVQKLLNLASNNPSEQEAASAAARAQALLVQYNLDAAAVESAGSPDGRREQALVEGGHYAHQREIWGMVAELNFCLHWVQNYRAKGNWRVKDGAGGRVRVPGYRTKRRHMLVGRVVNTRLTIEMAKYLEAAVERVALEQIKERRANHLSQWAMSFRRGAAARVVERLRDRREALLAEERERTRAAERAASGASTGTALTISVYVDRETDANLDFIYGEGWSAGEAVKRAKRAAERERQLREATEWAAANPEEAAAKEREREKAAEKAGRRYRGGRASRDGTDYGAYYTGYDAAEGIGIDEQVGSGSTPRRRIAS